MDPSQNIPPPPSGTLVIPPPPSGNIVMPQSSTPAPAATPQAPSVPMNQGLTGDLATPTGEGVYNMHDKSGHVMQIPFSNVRKAAQAGMLFTDKNTLQQYARDYSAKPIDEGWLDHYLRTAPWWDVPSHVVNQLQGMGKGALELAVSHDRPATTSFEQNLQLAAAQPSGSDAAKKGELAEGMGEFFSGEELLGILGKTGAAVGEGLSSGDKLKEASQLAQFLQRNPTVAKLLRVGVTAAKQGSLSAAQTGAHGGDADAMVKAGEIGAGTAGLAEAGGQSLKAVMGKFAQEPAPSMTTRNVAGVDIPVSTEAAEATATPTAAKSAEAYGKLSREAIADSAKNVAKVPEKVDAMLNSTHDLTGAIARQEEMLKPAYEHLNTLSNGRFGELNREVSEAQSLARSGRPEDVQALKAKISEMDQLLDQASGGQGKVFGDYLKNVKTAWRQNYILKDFGGSWDRNLNGAPGASKVSNEQRGINGNGLMRDIQRTIKTYGRDYVEKGLGPGRLEAFEQIAKLNQTNAQRVAFNMAVKEVAKSIPPGISELGKRAIAATVGGGISHLAGASPYAGMVAGEATYETVNAVMNAVKTNPKIAKNLIFAIDSGATPQHYGPLIAGMISNQMKNDQGDKQQ